MQDILPSGGKLSRLSGHRDQHGQKRSGYSKFRIALAFPDLYEIGTSHFGIQILCHILENRSGNFAERVLRP
ncbi:MAG: hypothetical protein R2941_01230 [Desulfobacterales bacterium]